MKQPDAHETYQVAASKLHWVALGLLGSLLAIVAGMYWLARPLMTAVEREGPPAAPPAPRLQPDPARDLAALQRAERAKLETYAWADAQRSVARIPIARAMQLLAESPPPAPSTATAPAPVQAGQLTPTPPPPPGQSAPPAKPVPPPTPAPVEPPR